MEIPHQFNLSDYPEVATVREAFPGCPVMPLSRLTVNETAVNNGDVKSFTVSFSVRRCNKFRLASGLCKIRAEGDGLVTFVHLQSVLPNRRVFVKELCTHYSDL